MTRPYVPLWAGLDVRNSERRVGVRPQLAVPQRKASMMRPLSVLAFLFILAIAGCSSESASEPTAVYDGTTCNYDGPSEFDLDERVRFTYTNESDHIDVGFSVWAVPEGTTADEIFEVGIFEVVGVDGPDDAPGFYAAAFAPTPIDETGFFTVTLDIPGQHAYNCFEDTDGGRNHAIMFTVSDN
jgi:hypothetical protein